MSIVEQENHVDLDDLRRQLKQWENDFRNTNGGRKAGRADIKKDASISAKYKLYDTLTKRAPRKAPPPANDAVFATSSTRPAKSQALAKEETKSTITNTLQKTPKKSLQSPLQPPASSFVQEIEATPAFIRHALGPTPQKDGHVLGIFDLLSTGTPSKSDDPRGRLREDIVAGTPSRGTSSRIDALSMTPQSPRERCQPDAFSTTPLKRKREDNMGTNSSSKRKFATPAFLRRSFPLAAIDEESAESMPPPPFRRRGLARSLSSIIQGLKKQEQERMDDEWDILQEIEQEERDGPRPKPKPAAKVLVEDSQPSEMSLGPDQAPESSEDSASEGGGNARKPWKKKGLKRQTRRVIMRPVLHKAKKVEVPEEDDRESGDEVVPETQLQDDSNAPQNDDQDPNLSDFVDDNEGKSSKAKATKANKKQTTKTTPAQGGKDAPATSDAKKPRKVKPDAHANFRKLKIKNKNSKANGRGRFGRR